MNNNALLLLGTNMGNRQQQLELTCQAINQRLGTVVKQSALYSTAPWGHLANQPFLNQCVLLQTQLTPLLLLKQIKQLEVELGRTPRSRWDNREIDIDILLYNQNILVEKQLIIPHPWFHKRNFAIFPAKEIVPHMIHPVLNQPINAL